MNLFLPVLTQPGYRPDWGDTFRRRWGRRRDNPLIRVGGRYGKGERLADWLSQVAAALLQQNPIRLPPAATADWAPIKLSVAVRKTTAEIGSGVVPARFEPGLASRTYSLARDRLVAAATTSPAAATKLPVAR